MENNFRLKRYQAIALITLIMINKLILNIPYYIVNLVGNGAIVNIIYITVIDFIGLLVILKLFEKFENQDILDISEFIGTAKLKTIIGIICITIFFIGTFITILDFSNVLHTIYFSNFPIIYILVFFIVGILIANLINLKSISNIISFIIPFAIASILITFFARSKDFNITNLTPILGKNYYTTFVLGLTNTFAMYFIVYIYFFKPLLYNQADFKKISIISYIISSILLLITVIPLLTLFNTTNGNEPINSLFLLARQIEFGTFLQRVDALFILLWILSIYAYLSFVIFLINRIIKKITNVSDEKMISFSTCSILFGLSMIPLNISQIHFIQNIIYRYMIIGFIFGLGLIILIWGNIKYRKVKSNDKK